VTVTRRAAPEFEAQVVELGMVAPDLVLPAPAKPLSVRLSAIAAGLAALLCVTLWIVVAHRSRTITSTVRTLSPTSHGTDAIGCPYGRVCVADSYPPDPMAGAANSAFGAVTRLDGETTSDGATARVYLGVVSLETYQGDRVDIRTRCVPGESLPATVSVVVLPAVNGVTEIQGHRADRTGCSTLVSYRTHDATRIRKIEAVVSHALADRRLTIVG
jgi:hypothetical protein